MKPTTKDGSFKKAVVKKFMKTGGCPFCNSFNYGYDGKTMMDGNTESMRVTCADCRQQWWNIFELTTIDPVRER